ncbi:hypothetical protein Back11_61370 [Paenibacillus baekrokdamisoli]|uniref:Uncharacterized protein n=1 Tax=Paenibacillus baekrokdamisoli TaxID=1712516 RepID=A0A3G9J2J9_9BACL|nr:DUF3298 domain-containing protein [Paenibacillus baekrokdamisoli]MBB3072209.1 hypothetical protein [Paenibacillus baekrokdamisoli]BBH24792.1 hypothetical protein Back11_61370 [Paenibacillus baekrokdamisoli]
MSHTRMNIPMKLMTIGAVSALLLTTGAQLSFASDAQSMNKATAATAANSIQASVKVTTKTFNETTDNYTARLQIPVIDGLLDKKYQAELNDILSRHAMEDFTIIKKQANNEAASLKKDPTPAYEFHPYDVEVQYELKSNGSKGTNGILSLKVLTSTYTGGAHGSTRVDTYNVRNKAAATRITLKDLFGTHYKKVINAKIKSTIAKDPESYYKDGFKSISEEQSFYVQDGRAVIVFQQYEIAPYAAGIPEINIALPGHTTTTPGNLSALSVMVNGKALKSTSLYTNDEGIAMVPLRTVAEALGYQLNRIGTSKVISVSNGKQLAYLETNKDNYGLDGLPTFTIGAAPVQKNGKLYVPAAFFSKVLKVKVAYSSNAVTFTTGS